MLNEVTVRAHYYWPCSAEVSVPLMRLKCLSLSLAPWSVLAPPLLTLQTKTQKASFHLLSEHLLTASSLGAEGGGAVKPPTTWSGLSSCAGLSTFTLMDSGAEGEQFYGAHWGRAVLVGTGPGRALRCEARLDSDQRGAPVPSGSVGCWETGSAAQQRSGQLCLSSAYHGTLAHAAAGRLQQAHSFTSAI